MLEQLEHGKADLDGNADTLQRSILLPQEKRAQSKPGPKLTEADRRAVIAHYMTSGSIQLTANVFNLHRNTVSELVKTVREANHSVLSGDWRSGMRGKAVVAVNAGLDCPDDPYKRGTLGKEVLKGLGDFAPDQGQVNVLTMLQAMPAELRALCDAEHVHAFTQHDGIEQCGCGEVRRELDSTRATPLPVDAKDST